MDKSVLWRQKSLEREKSGIVKLYHYQGPSHLLGPKMAASGGVAIHSAADLERWIALTKQRRNAKGQFEATFVVAEEGILRVADRRSEHVVCAGGGAVRAAGEIFFTHTTQGWKVEEITNQSTGYCPEPESWPEVAAALDQIPLLHPDNFTTAYLFRRCPACQQVNLIKEQDFFCAVCGAELPEMWNLGPGEP